MPQEATIVKNYRNDKKTSEAGNQLKLDFYATDEQVAEMKKYIQKMKGQTCWKLLKHFEYDTNLSIKKQFWDDKSISEEVLCTARSFELTKNAIQYLKKIFNYYKV